MISALALFNTAAAAYYSNGTSTTTVAETQFTTIECSTPTAFEYGTSTYYITLPTTLTIEECDCTKKPVPFVSADLTSAPTTTHTTVTEDITEFVTIPCSSTTLTYGSGTYTVTAATTLTLENCKCTDNTLASAVASPTPQPVIPLASTPSISPVTETIKATSYITIPCSSTTFTYNSKTYTVSSLTTLTVEDCSCTETVPLPTLAKTTSPSAAALVTSTTTPAVSAPAVVSADKTTVPSIANGAIPVASAGIAGAIAAIFINLL